MFHDKKRRIVFILSVVAIVVGGAVLLFFSLQGNNSALPSVLPSLEKDLIPPLTAIISPRGGSWHGANFMVEIQDSDFGLGSTNVWTSGKDCEYFIEDAKTKKRMGDYRVCGKSLIQIPIGFGEVCSSSYDPTGMSSGKCLVHTRAFDKAGNDSGWSSTLFNIDLIPPSVGRIVFSSSRITPLKEYLFETQVLDNAHITGCSLYIDGVAIKSTAQINPSPCEDNIQCIISAHYTFETEGSHSILFGCKDTAGNVGYGMQAFVDVFVNTPPKIDLCRVSPTQGNNTTQFKFSVDVRNLDGDILGYEWDFGDGSVSRDASPYHEYLIFGVYSPSVIVRDIYGATANCATAWVVVQK